MGLLVLSLSVPEFYLTKDKSAAVDDQVGRKTIEKVCIEENPRNYVDAFSEPHGGGDRTKVGALPVSFVHGLLQQLSPCDTSAKLLYAKGFSYKYFFFHL
jgi:hypothetical protein